MAASADPCATPAPSSSYLSTGKEDRVSTLDVYVSGAESSSAAIILATDAFGWKAPRIRQLADWLAVQGFYVVVPDLLHKDPYMPGLTDFGTWFPKHNAVEAAKEAELIVEHVKGSGIQKIGGAGFCWGAKVVANLSGLEAVGMLHPSRVTVEEIQALSVPVIVLAAELDSVTPVSLVEDYKTAIEGKSEIAAKSLVKIFPGVKHGFSIRYDGKDEEKAAFEARQDLVAFFSENLD